ncbi:MAG TPA: ABC transporter ATP-binding protein [Gemmatimonadales bacterium]|nr:ABC transporter ATP-binding protein [Gemmatimonadales bacterium]
MARRARGLDRDLQWALGFIQPHWPRLGAVLAASLIGTALSLSLPYLSKLLVDDALLARDAAALVRIAGLIAAVTLASFGLNVTSGLLYTRTSAEILFDMRRAVYRHLQRLSPRYYARTPLGEIVSRLNTDIGEIQRVASDAALAWLSNAVYLMGTTAMLLWLDARLFLASLVPLPLAVWALVRYRRRLESAVADLRDRSASIGTFLIETLLGMKLVTAANAQDREIERFRRRNEAFVDALLRMRWLNYLAGGLPGLLLAASTAIVVLYGGSRAIAGAISIGTLVAFAAYQVRLLSPVQGLMGVYTGLATARVSLRRVREILDAPVEVVERSDARPLPRARGEVALEHISYSFDRGAPVLADVSFVVHPGEVVAMMGPSGAGKSTIADLLARHLDPDAGRILLDGHDLRSLKLADVRRHVAVVDQDPVVFNATIAENIRYARPDAPRADVERAARAAGLWGWIETLPRAYDTVVGERGKALSMGERQRLAIARAFLTDAAVVVLDEPTASLDSAAEAEVIAGYRQLLEARGRTIILITHRHELAAAADRVLVLEAGRVTEAMTAAAGASVSDRRVVFARAGNGGTASAG